MEILRQDFEASLPMLQKAIAECDFVAMDTEITGSDPNNAAHRGFPVIRVLQTGVI